MTQAPVDPAVRDAFMAMAIAEARKGVGRTHPNPPVGAVLVREGVVVGRGFTQPIGKPHAEAEAIRDAGERAQGADLYVTLEPCNHFGRQPPCTDAILSSGVARVFIGSIDPNPKVSGRGLQRLKDAGIEIVTHVLEPACSELIRAFRKHITTDRPLVVLKAAATLDGKLATRTGDSKWISGDASRHRVHGWRDEFDAVLVGAGTVKADDPLLTTRLEGEVVAGRPPRNPIRVVLAGDTELAPTARIFDTAVAPTLLATPSGQGVRWEAHHARGAEVLALPSTDQGIHIDALLDALGERGITSLLVEGGAAVHASFLKAGVVDEVRLFIAPCIAGGDGLSWMGPLGIDAMSQAWRLIHTRVEQIDNDLLVVGTPAKPAGK